MKRLRLSVLSLSLLGTIPALAFDGLPLGDQSPTDAAGFAHSEDLQAEILDVSTETAMSNEDTVPPPPDEGMVADCDVAGASWQQDAQSPEFFTLGELREEMKGLSWVKGNTKITPYGLLWGSVSYDTARTTPRRFALWVPTPEDEGESQFVIDTRRTRLGVDLEGPEIAMFGGARFMGRVETDFYGRFITENQPDMRLRHAYGEFKNDDFRVMAGQTWDLISPLLPQTVNFPVGWAAGNIGFRRMQVRLDRYFHPSDDMVFEVAGAIADSVVNNFVSLEGAQRETSNWPLLEGRVGIKLSKLTQSSSPVAIGISGHIGEEGFDFTVDSPPAADDVRVRTWSFNVDARIPITDRCGIQGEFFTGENLATFLGGIVQGVDPTTRDGIQSTGGWIEAWYDWTPKWHSHAGFSLDDPKNRDLTTASARTYNRFFYINTSYDVTKNLNFGMEISDWKTEFLGQDEGSAVRFEFAGRYKF